MRRRSYRVLLADDDPTAQRLEQLLLEGEGYEVIAVENGDDALKALEEDQPDIVLLDIGMPKLDGFTICQRIRSISQVPIVIVTGRDSSADKVWGLKAGADDYITKPFDTDEFFARLAAVLRRPALPLVPAAGRLSAVGHVNSSQDAK
ncbi:MAG: response regulator transcription factor, partial [Dehalococcoidia bacterium]